MKKPSKPRAATKRNDPIVGWCVQQRSPLMSAPAFWYYRTRREALRFGVASLRDGSAVRVRAVFRSEGGADFLEKLHERLRVAAE